MKPFSGDEDRIIRRMVLNYSDADIARELRRTSDHIKRRCAELGIRRTEAARTRNRTKTPVAEPTPEELAERIAMVQATWTESQWRDKAQVKAVRYEVPDAVFGE